METERYYLKGSRPTRSLQRVLVVDGRVAHASAEYFELSYRERVALALENRKGR